LDPSEEDPAAAAANSAITNDHGNMFHDVE
jgi:hypothetical protein